MHRVDPPAGEVGKDGEILGSGQHRGLEPTHSARRRRATLHGRSAHELAHHRIAAQPTRVVDVLVAGQPRENRLPQELGEVMTAVQTSTRIGEQRGRHIGQAESVVQFPVQEQAAVRAERRALERELDGPVELEPERVRFRFTRRVRRHSTSPIRPTH